MDFKEKFSGWFQNAGKQFHADRTKRNTYAYDENLALMVPMNKADRQPVTYCASPLVITDNILTKTQEQAH